MDPQEMNANADTQQAPYNPSALMTAYNLGKNWARRTDLTTTDRVDRAFGYLMSGDASSKWMDYATTADSCDCPDSQYRGIICKHSIALMIAEKHDRIMKREGLR